jgi:two-component system sensor histidine kinase QseC
MTSLKQRCFQDIAALAALTWLLLSGGLLALVSFEGRRMFDDALRERAGLVLAFTAHEVDEIRASGPSRIDEDLVGDSDDGLLVQVWQADGRLAFRNRPAPTAPLASPFEGFRDLAVSGHAMRAYSAWSEDRRFRVQIAEMPRARKGFAASASALVAAVMLLGLAAFLLRLRATLQRAFGPLDCTARELAARPPGAVEPVSTANQPAELVPVIEAFNAMMVRVQRALLHEQRFTADAAHELRTPLAALTVLLHNAGQAENDAARQEALAQMRGVVEQAARLVDQLLALARYDQAPEAFDLNQALDLHVLAARALGELQATAHARGTRLALQVQLGTATQIETRGHPEALLVLMRNLIDNALRFAPPGGRVDVVLGTDAACRVARFEVHDDGPGIPPAMRARLMARFVRGAGQDMPGTGLGLAIAERIAQLHGGRLELGASARLGGTLAAAVLPLPAA